jgi:hypothetical protein
MVEMRRTVGLLFAVGSMAGVALAAPSGAFGATTLGQTFIPDDCSEETYIQTASPPGGPSYSAPFDGVITQWSYQSDATPPPTVRLKVAQDLGGGTLKIVAQSDTESIVASKLNTYQSRVSMPAGTDLGEFIADDCSRSDDTFTDFFAGGDLSVGTTSSDFTEENFQQDIAAVLEPDADHDGFGDETQDQCPTNAGTQGSCPVTPGTSVKKKKCKKHKKKHKRSAESAKKHKKCKKKKKKH